MTIIDRTAFAEQARVRELKEMRERIAGMIEENENRLQASAKQQAETSKQ